MQVQISSCVVLFFSVCLFVCFSTPFSCSFFPFNQGFVANSVIQTFMHACRYCSLKINHHTTQMSSTRTAYAPINVLPHHPPPPLGHKWGFTGGIDSKLLPHSVADPGWGIWGKCPPFKKLHTRSIYSNRAVNYSNKAVTMFMRQCSYL